jgi:hypothetical protein
MECSIAMLFSVKQNGGLAKFFAYLDFGLTVNTNEPLEVAI